MSRRHHHGYAVSQLRSRTLLTKQCFHPWCREIVLSGLGRCVFACLLVVVVALPVLVAR